jgi:hypothetical protein
MKRIILLLVMCLITLAGSLIFGSGRVMAQQYEPCNLNNPSYCQECRDESKRDFAKCGEIDYRKLDFVATNRIFTVKGEKYFGNTMMGLDFDPYTKKVVYSAHVGKDTVNLEIFIANADRVGGSLIIDSKTKKRVTWDSVADHFSNIHPIWTKDRKIAYHRFDGEKDTNFLIEQDGSNKEEISEDDYYKKFLRGCHDKNLNFICPPSQ